LLVALAVVYVVLPPLQVGVIALAGFSGSAAMVYGVRRHRPVRPWPWYWLLIALLLSTAGQMISRLLPGPAGTYRLGSLILYGVLFVMSVLMVGGVIGLARSAPRDLTAVVDVTILLLGTGLLAGVLLAVPYALTPDLPAVQATARVLFVARDVVLLAAIVHFATSERWNGSVGLLVVGVVGFLTYDAAYRFALIRGVLLQGTGLDLCWLLFAAAWAMAALLPAMRQLGEPGAQSRRSTSLRLSLLTVASALPVALFMVATYQRTRPWYEPLVATVSAIMLALVLAQLLGVALRLRNQVAGEQALSRAVAAVAAANDVGAVTAVLEASVPLLSTGRATGGVRAAAGYQSPAPAVQADMDATMVKPPEVIALRLGAGPALACPLCRDDAEGLLVLYLRGDRAAMNRLWPRLDVLATQACLVLERIRLSRELIRRTTQEYVNAVAQTSGDVILLVDDSDRITLASHSAGSIFDTLDVIGVRLPDLIDDAARSAVTDLLRHARTSEQPSPGRTAGVLLDRSREAVTPPSKVTVEPPERVNTASLTVRRGDGSMAQLDVACRQVTSMEPSVRGLLVDLRDVTEQRRLERDLTERASRDPLTGLVSGLRVRERVRQDLEAHRDSLIGMIVLDIDDFKLINARHGLDVGDAVLRAVAARLTAAVPPSGLVGRVAGDRFAVIVDVAASADADPIANRLVDAVARPIDVNHMVVPCTASAGVASTADADTAQELARQAEFALLIARDEGRGRWHHYDPRARSTVIERLEIRAALEHALDQRELALEYQPIVDLETGVAAGFEALLRWHHPTYGQLSLATFIDVAEESKLIIPIGDWALATAARDARRWEVVATGEPPFISVNVSATQLESPNFFDSIHDQLATSGLPASRLHLEITESALLSDDTVWGDLQRLRGMGIQIAIDDFGTGYSALSYLGQVPVDHIKLDRQFVASMTASRTQRDLVEGIVELTRILKLDVIAEGVETTQERDLAAEVGCRFGQGYLFARPMTADATAAWLVEHRDRISTPAMSAPES
jgi:diguanylate cyclase (GGDEF)-like protein